MNRRFPVSFVQDGLKLEKLLNEVEVESSVIAIGDTGPCLLSSPPSLAVMLTSASGSQG